MPHVHVAAVKNIKSAAADRRNRGGVSFLTDIIQALRVPNNELNSRPGLRCFFLELHSIVLRIKTLTILLFLARRVSTGLYFYQ